MCVGVYQAGWGRWCKSLLKTDSPAECQSQTTENTGPLARALHARCFALALSFPHNECESWEGEDERQPGGLTADRVLG